MRRVPIWAALLLREAIDRLAYDQVETTDNEIEGILRDLVERHGAQAIGDLLEMAKVIVSQAPYEEPQVERVRAILAQAERVLQDRLGVTRG